MHEDIYIIERSDGLYICTGAYMDAIARGGVLLWTLNPHERASLPFTDRTCPACGHKLSDPFVGTRSNVYPKDVENVGTSDTPDFLSVVDAQCPACRDDVRDYHEIRSVRVATRRGFLSRLLTGNTYRVTPSNHASKRACEQALMSWFLHVRR